MDDGVSAHPPAVLGTIEGFAEKIPYFHIPHDYFQLSLKIFDFTCLKEYAIRNDGNHHNVSVSARFEDTGASNCLGRRELPWQLLFTIHRRHVTTTELSFDASPESFEFIRLIMSRDNEEVDDNGVPRDISFLYTVDEKWATKTGGFFCATNPSLVSPVSSGETCSSSVVKEDDQPRSMISNHAGDGIYKDKREKSLIEAREIPTYHGTEIPNAIEMEEPSYQKKDVLGEVLLCPRWCVNRYAMLLFCCLVLTIGLAATSWAHAHSKRRQIMSYRIARDRIQDMIDIEIGHGPFVQAIQWISSEDYIYRKMQLKDSELLQRFSMAAAYFATSEDTWKQCGRLSNNCKSPTAQWLGSFHECLWEGVRCDSFDRVTEIDWRT